jgi:adapter protein MecA 1/2
MRLERVNENKIKIFLSTEDLLKRGIADKELWEDIPKVHEFLDELLKEAENKLKFLTDCPIAVEVFLNENEGIVLEVTKSSLENQFKDELESDEKEDCHQEAKLSLFYAFDTFDAVIYACEKLMRIGVSKGSIYTKNNIYFIYIDETNMKPETIKAVLSEFGYKANETVYQVIEYGKLLLSGNCFNKITNIFLKI